MTRRYRIREEVKLDEAMNHKNHVMASPAGSSNVWLWKLVDSEAIPVKKYLPIVEAGKLQRDHGIKWVRYGAQKYFNDLKETNDV